MSNLLYKNMSRFTFILALTLFAFQGVKAEDQASIFQGALEGMYIGVKKAHDISSEENPSQEDVERSITRYATGVRYLQFLKDNPSLSYDLRKSINLLDDISSLMSDTRHSNLVEDAIMYLGQRQQLMNCVIDPGNSPQFTVVDFIYEISDMSCEPKHEDHVFYRFFQAEKHFVLGILKELGFMLLDISEMLRDIIGIETHNILNASGEDYRYIQKSGLFQSLEKHAINSNGNFINYIGGFVEEEYHSTVDMTLGQMASDDVVDQVMGIQTLGLIILGSKIKAAKLPSVKLPKLKIDMLNGNQLAASLVFETTALGSAVVLGPESLLAPLILQSNHLDSDSNPPQRRRLSFNPRSSSRRPEFNKDQSPEKILPEDIYQEPKNPEKTPEVSTTDSFAREGRTNVSDGGNEVLSVSYDTRITKIEVGLPRDLKDLDLPEDAVVLDVGAGTSGLIKEFREAGYDKSYAISPEYGVKAADIPEIPNSIRDAELEARRTDSNGVGMFRREFEEFMDANRSWAVPGWVDDLPIRTGTVDLIVCHKLFNNFRGHMQGAPAFINNMMPGIAEMYRTLKPGGVIKVDGCLN